MNKKKIGMIIILIVIMILSIIIISNLIIQHNNESQVEEITIQVFELYDKNNDDKLDFNELQIFLYGIEKQKDNSDMLNDYSLSISMTSLAFQFDDYNNDEKLNKKEFKNYARDHLINRGYDL